MKTSIRIVIAGYWINRCLKRSLMVLWSVLASTSASAATGSSPEFRIDIPQGSQFTTVTNTGTPIERPQPIMYVFQSGKEWIRDTSEKKTGTFSYRSYADSTDNFFSDLCAVVKGKGTFTFGGKHQVRRTGAICSSIM